MSCNKSRINPNSFLFIKPEKTLADKEYTKYLNAINQLYNSGLISNEEEESAYDQKIGQDIVNFNNEIPQMKLQKVFKQLNSNDYLKDMFYANVSAILDIDKNDINIFWSQQDMIRNANIYKNMIQDIFADKPQRVMVLFGAGHIKALKNYLDVHPAITIVPADTYLTA